MDELNAGFEQWIGLPWEDLRLPDEELVPIFGDDASAMLWGTPVAARRPILAQGDIFGFPRLAPDGYFLVGFWGHGVNTGTPA